MPENIPDWAKVPFKNFIDGASDLYEIIDLTKWGLLMSTALPKVCQNLATPGTSQEMLNDIEQKGLKAQKILDNKFPIIISQAVITLWTLIESTFRDFFASWLINIPQARQSAAIRKLKFSLGEYESFTDAEKYYYILDALEDSLGTKRCPGIARFEALFDLYNLSSKIEDKVKKVLFELSQVRNVLVHRHGIVDSKIIGNCPWLNLALNEKLIIKEETYKKYNMVASYYILECGNRVRKYFGLDRYEEGVPPINEFLRD